MKNIKFLFRGFPSTHTSEKRYRRRQEEKLRVLSRLNASETYDLLRSSERGLSPERVAASREKYGENKVPGAGALLAGTLMDAFFNPFTIILTLTGLAAIAAGILCVAPEERNLSAAIMFLIAAAGGAFLRLLLETRGRNAAVRLSDMIRTTACVRRRSSQEGENIPMEEIVVGDLVYLSAGDFVPADLRILEARDFFLSQSALTGEAAPVSKSAAAFSRTGALTDIPCLAFAGSRVVSGSAVGIAAAVGKATLLGSIAGQLNTASSLITFEKRVNALIQFKYSQEVHSI